MTPHLWAAGMDIATGVIVAITTSHFLPAPNYEAAILSSHQRLDAGGIGGRIDPPFGSGPVAWAVYLLRYSQYLGLAARPSVEDFAGDNGSYKASTLARYRDQIRAKGFWEHELHQQMRRDGIILAYDPTIEVRQTVAFPFFAFVGQRFSHGWRYGHELTAGEPWPRRLFLAGRATLVPALLMFRVARQVVASGRYGHQFLLALPLLVVFSLAWGLGEGGGCLVGKNPRWCLRS